MRRRDLQRLAEERLRDAAVLLRARRYGAAYYLLGYSVECAIKACIAKRFQARTIPDKGLVNSIYQHDLERLMTVAGLNSAFRQAQQSDSELAAKWIVVVNWKPEARYQRTIARRDALELHEAVGNPTHGVLQWLRRHW